MKEPMLGIKVCRKCALMEFDAVQSTTDRYQSGKSNLDN
jgi:hypothetical protein